MATLAEQRRSIQAGVNSSRAATGADQRRAIGQRIEAERRGESVVQDLNRLITPAQQRRTLRPVQPTGALPATRGRATYTPPPATSTGGGIASPLTEQSYAAREFHPAKYLETSDGLFTFEIKPIKKVVLTDANSAVHDFNYASPP